MRVVLLGAPGAGKGTQASLICKTFDLARFSTGDMLRAEVLAKSTIGQSVAEIMARGQLVPDAIAIQLIQTHVQALADAQGFLLDGFPRTLEQAQALENAGIYMDQVIYLEVPDETIIQRLSGRRIHPASGRTYHLQTHPAQVDDLTGEPLVQREDDSEAVVTRRLAIYHQTTEPLIAWYAQKTLKFIRVSGIGTVETIGSNIEKAMRT
ncbi:MAG: adenylate kinase [Gammaproteobacteria bacterium]|nr:adenylate kinase [Gammaproteobacteria bacterium]MBP9729308.1 adenylate kinase [Gammaproteobacteria bacterium]